MQNAGAAEEVGLSASVPSDAGAAPPLPLVVAMPLIAGLSVALWLGVSGVIQAAFWP